MQVELEYERNRTSQPSLYLVLCNKPDSTAVTLRYALAVLSLRRRTHALRQLPGHTSVLQQITKGQDSAIDSCT